MEDLWEPEVEEADLRLSEGPCVGLDRYATVSAIGFVKSVVVSIMRRYACDAGVRGGEFGRGVVSAQVGKMR